MSNAALINNCTRTAWSSGVGCCQRGHKIYRLSVPACEKRYFLSLFTFEHIMCLSLPLIYPAVYLLNKDLCEIRVS